MNTSWAEMMNSLPALTETSWYEPVRQAVDKKTDVIIELDDDPTCSQTSNDVSVLTDSYREGIEQVLRRHPAVFILTNSGSFQKETAIKMGRGGGMGSNILILSELLGEKCRVISRNDSTF